MPRFKAFITKATLEYYEIEVHAPEGVTKDEVASGALMEAKEHPEHRLGRTHTMWGVEDVWEMTEE